MVANHRELMNGIAVLADDRNVRVTLKQSAKGGLICGASAFCGSLLAGPAGLAVGGTIGGLAGYLMTKGTFRPLSEVIRKDLTTQQREQLTFHIMNFCRDLEITDVASLVALMSCNTAIQAQVLKLAISFVQSELQMSIAN